MLIARRRPFAVRKKYGAGLPSVSLTVGCGPPSTSRWHSDEFNSASKPACMIAVSKAEPPFSNIQIINSDRRCARLIIMQRSRSSVAHQHSLPNAALVSPLSRVTSAAGFVALRQIFVRHSQGCRHRGGLCRRVPVGMGHRGQRDGGQQYRPSSCRRDHR